jgi:hypothetical protein
VVTPMHEYLLYKTIPRGCICKKVFRQFLEIYNVFGSIVSIFGSCLRCIARGTCNSNEMVPFINSILMLI